MKGLYYLALAILLVGNINATSTEWARGSISNEVDRFNAEGRVRIDDNGYRIISDDIRKKIFGEEIIPTPGFSGCMQYNGAPMGCLAYKMISSRSLDNSTISLFGTANGDYDAIDKILEESNALTTQGQNKVTSLMVAVAAGRNDIVERLLAHNVKLEAKDSWGRTALIYAVMEDNPVAVDMLLKHGAEYNVTHGGKTAIQIAYKMKFRRVLDILAAYGATF